MALEAAGFRPSIYLDLESEADRAVSLERIVTETTGKKRNRVYRYDQYLEILNEGMEPL